MKRRINQLLLRKREILGCGTIVLCFFLLTQGIICAVMVLLRPEESVLVTGLLIPAILSFCLTLLVSQNITIVFEAGLRMGRTRREMRNVALWLTGAELLLAIGLCVALILLERTACMPLWAFLAGRPGAVVMENAPGGGQLWEPIFATGVLRVEDFSFPVWQDLLLLLIGGGLGFVDGVVSRRFGGRYAMVLWMPAWILFLNRGWILERVPAVAGPWLLAGGIFLLVVGICWAARSLLHAAVHT